jgi:hypothetical protein
LPPELLPDELPELLPELLPDELPDDEPELAGQGRSARQKPSWRSFHFPAVHVVP